jgi:hypothetical protein
MFVLYIYIYIYHCKYSVVAISGIRNVTSPDTVVNIATHYGLDGPGIEYGWGRYFLHPSGPALGPKQPSVNGYCVSFPGVRRTGRGVHHPSPPSAEIKERVALYLYSPSGPSWPVIG